MPPQPQLSTAIVLAILGQMTQDNSVTGNQHVADDIARLQQYIQTGIDPGGAGSPGIDPNKVAELLQPIQDGINQIVSGLPNLDPNIIAQQVQSLLDNVKALQQYLQTGPTAPVVTGSDNTANPLASHQQNFPSKGV